MWKQQLKKWLVNTLYLLQTVDLHTLPMKHTKEKICVCIWTWVCALVWYVLECWQYLSHCYNLISPVSSNLQRYERNTFSIAIIEGREIRECFLLLLFRQLYYIFSVCGVLCCEKWEILNMFTHKIKHSTKTLSKYLPFYDVP